MILCMHQHQADFHLPFPLVAFDKLSLHQVRFIQRDTGLIHHGLSGGKIALLGLLQGSIRQATCLPGVDDKPHHHFFQIVLYGVFGYDTIQI